MRSSARTLWGGARRWRSSRAPEDSPLRRLLDDASEFGEAPAVTGPLQWATQPYAWREPRDSARAPRASLPAVAPQEATVLLFPGQGSQFVGMGKRLAGEPEVRDLYDFASEVVGWDVWRVCTEGPEDELAERCQTCVLVTSLAAAASARAARPAALARVRAAAGFSLGELTALVFADALPLHAALRLAAVRSAAMAAASRERAGGMLTVWLAPDARLPELLARARAAAEARGVTEPVCAVANYLYPGCKVLAGDEEALREVERAGRALGVRRAARVAVAGAFHTPLMARARDAVREALRHAELRAPALRVLSGVDARPYGAAPAQTARTLAAGVTAPVRWEQVLHALYARARAAPQPLTLALGPGAALRATLKQVNARAWDSSLQLDV